MNKIKKNQPFDLQKAMITKPFLRILEKKIDSLFKKLKAAKKNRARLRTNIHNQLYGLEIILKLDHFQELYKAEWDFLYEKSAGKMQKRLETIRGLIEVLLANDDCRIAYPKMVRRFCDKYLTALEDNYT